MVTIISSSDLIDEQFNFCFFGGGGAFEWCSAIDEEAGRRNC